MLTIRTPTNRARFLASLGECGNVTQACMTVHISRVAAYAWRREDPVFAEAWDDALALGISGMEDRATQYAMDGSEKLMMFLLQSRRPEVYGQRQAIEFNGTMNVNVRRAPLDELRAELAQMLARQPLTIDEEPSNVVALPPRDEPEV